VTTVYDVPAEPLILRTAKELRGMKAIAPPEWAAFVRTGVHSERPPEQADWWHIRAAAVLRKLYTTGPLGVERLSAEYGGSHDRGSKPFHAKKGSRKIARTVLQQLEAAGLVAAADKRQGRKVTPAGQKLLDNVAHDVRKDLAASVPALAKY